MSYPKQLMRLRPTGGLVRDVPPHEVGPNHYISAFNVVFRLGFASRLPGYRVAYDPPPTPPLALMNLQDASANYWLIAGDHLVYVVDGATQTDVSPTVPLATQSRPSLHSFAELNGVAVYNNAIDVPHY